MARNLLAIIFEHPDWHEPLFEVLDSRNISYAKIDLKKGAYSYYDIPEAEIYYNMVSPSAYLRSNQKAIPFAFSICKTLELEGKQVLNGSKSMSLEFSKSTQIALLKSLRIDHPASIFFNDIESLKKYTDTFKWPMILKPEQGGSGAKMYLVNSFEELQNLFNNNPNIWQPDNLFLLQEKLNYDVDFGIVRLEFIGETLLYAMRVVTHGTFNLCPSIVCNPDDNSAGICQIENLNVKNQPEFFPYAEVPEEAVKAAREIIKAAGHHLGSVEYINTFDGRRVFYDINANSNLRKSIGEKFGIDPFFEVVNYIDNLVKSPSNI